MGKKQFTSLDQLQRYLSRNDIINTVFRDKNIKSVLASTMSQAIYDVVYGHYVPVKYQRRRNNGGLGDVRNMDFTKVEVVDGKVRILFENLTKGQTHQIVYKLPEDTAKNQFLTDIIVEEHSDVWHRQGKWSESRDFVSETVRRIQANPTYLINAIKDSYRKLGFEVK